MTAPTATTTAAQASPASAAGGSPGRPGRGRLWVWIVLALVGCALVALAAGAPNRNDRPPYDPESNDVDGTKALVKLLRDFGADVDVHQGVPDDRTDVAIMFPGEASDVDQAGIREWVRRGHTLVVTDTASDLLVWRGDRNVFPAAFPERIPQGDCPISAIRDAKSLGLAERAQFSAYQMRYFPVPPDGQGCYPQAEAEPGLPPPVLLVAQPTGKGEIVSFGLPSVFTNVNLDTADNAVLAVDLLAPRPGTRVTIVQASEGTAKDRGLEDVLALGVKLAILQLGLAFVVYAFFRARRLGRPVMELQPVQIPGSELVSAVGNLLQQTRSPDRAAALLRADLRRRVAERLGLPPGCTPDVMANTIEARTGLPADQAMPALLDLPCPTDDELLSLAGQIDTVRRTVLGAGS